ncbi:MAG: rhodanese-like domain-containing protein [Phycisphaerales bacterium]|nr:rhodanese-like domain-containing protein [Phycisphaerales bacterium]
MRWLVILMTVTLSGCGPSWSDRSLNFISVEQARSLTDTDGTWLEPASTTVWVDGRNVERYTLGHIPGAICMPLRSVDVQWRRVERAGTVIVYANTWNDPIADALSKALLERGIEHVKTLNGGWDAWIEAGGAQATGADSDLIEDASLRLQRRTAEQRRGVTRRR